MFFGFRGFMGFVVGLFCRVYRFFFAFGGGGGVLGLEGSGHHTLDPNPKP